MNWREWVGGAALIVGILITMYVVIATLAQFADYIRRLADQKDAQREWGHEESEIAELREAVLRDQAMREKGVQK